MEESQRTGLLGEVYAARYLREQGYVILASNYRVKAGELDLVAARDGVCVFVEVKTRRAGGLFAPAEAVDTGKQERVMSAAAAFLASERIAERLEATRTVRRRRLFLRKKKPAARCEVEQRFDIIEVELDGEAFCVNHLVNAF